MVKLFCVLVGVGGSAFSVQVDENDSVDDLKDAIWAKGITEEQKCGNVASKLELYLAKKGDVWLNKETALAVTLDKERHAVLEVENGIPQHFVMMDETSDIVNYLGENFKREQGKIHVLVVVPHTAN
jgi:Crinkler effector protein N-terminal domain